MIEKRALKTKDGFGLCATLYKCKQPQAYGTIIIIGDILQDQSAYGEYAAYLSNQCWQVVTFDYRGTGCSKLPSAFNYKINEHNYSQFDLGSVIQWVKNMDPNMKIVALTHGNGISLLANSTSKEDLDAVASLTTQAHQTHWWIWPKIYLIYAYFNFYIPVCFKYLGLISLKLTKLDEFKKNLRKAYSQFF